MLKVHRKIKARPLGVRGLCLHLGKKLSGPQQLPCQCKHECEAGEEYAIPGGVCQTCTKWEAS